MCQIIAFFAVSALFLFVVAVALWPRRARRSTGLPKITTPAPSVPPVKAPRVELNQWDVQ